MSSSRASSRTRRMRFPRTSTCCEGPSKSARDSCTLNLAACHAASRAGVGTNLFRTDSMLPCSKEQHGACSPLRNLSPPLSRKKLSETCDAKTKEWDVREKTRSEDRWIWGGGGGGRGFFCFRECQLAPPANLRSVSLNAQTPQTPQTPPTPPKPF